LASASTVAVGLEENPPPISTFRVRVRVRVWVWVSACWSGGTTPPPQIYLSKDEKVERKPVTRPDLPFELFFLPI